MQRDGVSVAVVGLGPRGLNVLERITAYVLYGKTVSPLSLHLFEPGTPGAGIHHLTQPDYLWLNTVASQITMFMDSTVQDAGPLLPGPSLYEWALGTDGLEIPDGPNTYLPRRRFGEYLNWIFTYLVDHLDGRCEVHLHRKEVVDIAPAGAERYALITDDGEQVTADYLFLTTGHTENHPDDVDQVREAFVARNAAQNRHLRYVLARPTPFDQELEKVSPSAKVAIEGMGLTAIDVIASLTVGRGGRFNRDPVTGMLIYRPSGREPAIALLSRSGLPLSARGINQKGVSDQYQARFLTRERVAAWRAERGPGGLDFHADVLPLLLRDMAHIFHMTHARRLHGQAFADLLDEASRGLDAAAAEALFRRHCPDTPAFSWQRMVTPIPDEAQEGPDAFQAWLVTFLEADVAEARIGNVDSPVKAACDVLRDLRDNIRDAIDFGMLTAQSHHRFISEFIPLMNRLAVGPPLERVEELAALVRAGYLNLGFGPGARVTTDAEAGCFLVESSVFPGMSVRADVLVRARVPKSSPCEDRSRLTRRLVERGLIRPFSNNGVEIGGIDVDPSLRIVNATGRVLPNAWALGTVCEGAKFYTYIVPRPNVNSTALVDAGRSVGALVRMAQGTGVWDTPPVPGDAVMRRITETGACRTKETSLPC